MAHESTVNVYASTVNGKLTVDELLKKEEEFPFCSMIQFQLLQEYSTLDNESFKERAEKSALYFGDLLKLNWILHLNNSAMQEAKQLYKSNGNNDNVIIRPIIVKEEITPIEPAKIVDTPYVVEKAPSPIQDSQHLIEEENVEVHAPYIDDVAPMEPLIYKEDNIEEPVSEIQDTLPKDSITATETPIIEIPDQDDLSNNLSNESGEFASLKTGADDSSKSLPDELVFEPLYTKDYFASLGIKWNDNPAPTDKLGNQMKSFTQWLKSMKKINLEKLNEPDEVVDKKIQTIAEKSNSTEEVITESMADVLLLQGKHEKAIEMYEKLSLINPSKSAYFAAIIQVLKKA